MLHHEDGGGGVFPTWNLSLKKEHLAALQKNQQSSQMQWFYLKILSKMAQSNQLLHLKNFKFFYC